MRALLVAALVFVVALAGCSAKKGGDDDVHATCSNGTEIHYDDYEGVLNESASKEEIISFLKTKCPKIGGSGSKTNTTAAAPNVLPVLKLNVTDFAGNVTNVTLLNGNLTFSAEGSSDPDGTISAIAISVQDSNTTRTLPLYDLATKTFKSATFKFDRAGPVNVSVAMVDDRAGFNGTVTKVYVNQAQTVGGQELHGPVAAANDACKGANQGSSSSIIDSYYFKSNGFTVAKGASFIEAIPKAGTVVTICDPTGTAISPTKQSKQTFTNEGVVLTAPASTETYAIGTYASAPRTVTSVQVIVHYEPRPAAAAA